MGRFHLLPVARNLTESSASFLSGQHYGGEGALPMIPGIDGTGRAPDGTRVYFVGVRPPYGPMAQRAAAAFTLPLPDGLDEVTVAAIVNPGTAPGWR
jgi:hypothetical protein